MCSTNQAGTGKLPPLVQVASLPSSAFIRGRFGLKCLENLQSKACTGFLLPLSCNSERSLGVSFPGSPAACGHQGAPPEVLDMITAEQPPERVCLGRPAAAAWSLLYSGGCCSSSGHPGAQFGESSRPLAFALTRPPPELPTQCSAGSQLLQGQVRHGDPAADELGLVLDKGQAPPRPN